VRQLSRHPLGGGNNNMKIFLCSICILLSCASCKKEATTQPPNDPFERWRSYGIHNYTIDQTRSCFCPNGGEKMWLFVKSDTVNSVIRLSDGTVLAYGSFPAYWSVESLFSYIKLSTDSMVVRYNDKYGFPEYLDISPERHPVDAGALYETINLQIQ
jgi:hypothetical protein